MGRHESEVQRDAEGPLSLDELLGLLGTPGKGDARSRDEAIACFLSGSDGWKEAVTRLGGTFAEGATELRERKDG